jgi:hypothetical protein
MFKYEDKSLLVNRRRLFLYVIPRRGKHMNVILYAHINEQTNSYQIGLLSTKGTNVLTNYSYQFNQVY